MTGSLALRAVRDPAKQPASDPPAFAKGEHTFGSKVRPLVPPKTRNSNYCLVVCYTDFMAESERNWVVVEWDENGNIVRYDFESNNQTKGHSEDVSDSIERRRPESRDPDQLVVRRY